MPERPPCACSPRSSRAFASTASAASWSCALELWLLLLHLLRRLLHRRLRGSEGLQLLQLGLDLAAHGCHLVIELVSGNLFVVLFFSSRARWKKSSATTKSRAAWHADYRANGFFAWLGLPRFHSKFTRPSSALRASLAPFVIGEPSSACSFSPFAKAFRWSGVILSSAVHCNRNIMTVLDNCCSSFGDEEHQVVTGLVRVDEHRLPLWCSSVVVGAFATSSMLSKMASSMISILTYLLTGSFLFFRYSDQIWALTFPL